MPNLTVLNVYLNRLLEYSKFVSLFLSIPIKSLLNVVMLWKLNLAILMKVSRTERYEGVVVVDVVFLLEYVETLLC